METREELLDGLKEAISLMKQITDLTYRKKTVNQNKEGIRPEIEALTGFRAVILELIVGAVLLWPAINKMVLEIAGQIIAKNESAVDRMSEGVQAVWYVIIQLIPVVIAAILAILVKKLVNKGIVIMNKRIEKENVEIMLHNDFVQKDVEVVRQQLLRIQIAYRDHVLPWYPENYCYIAAAEFFYDAVKNYRADTLKEVINLYENTMHQRRVESNQKQMIENQEEAIRQQKLNNILTVGVMLM